LSLFFCGCTKETKPTAETNPSFDRGNSNSPIKIKVKSDLKANVMVSTSPSGAQVFLDGVDTGSVTDCMLWNVA